MCELYKLELGSRKLAEKVQAMIHWFGDDCVIESDSDNAAAVITDHQFSQGEAELLLGQIGSCVVAQKEELTAYDVTNFDSVACH